MLVAGAVVYLGTRAVRRDPRAGEGAGGDRPAGPPRRPARPAQPRPTGGRGQRSSCATPSAWSSSSPPLASTLLALRDAPVGFDDSASWRSSASPSEAEGEAVAFLGVDRFAGYYLRETLARAPAGYVPEEIDARPEKRWQQGDAADFDTLDAGQLDKFDYAITTAAAYASTPPPNFEPVATRWRLRALGARGRDAAQPRARGRGWRPRRVNLDCDQLEGRPGTARRCSRRPRSCRYDEWTTCRRWSSTRRGGQERGFEAPGDGRRRRSRCREPGAVRALAAVPLAGAARGASSTARWSPSCPPRSTACT